MLFKFLFVSYSIVFAQNATVSLPNQPVIASNATTTTTTTTNPLIPSSVSPACHLHLQQLNSDPVLALCTTPLLAALALFAPAPNHTAPSLNLTTTLESLCTGQRCSDTLVRSALLAFAGNCSVELEAQQEVVLASYDTLYILNPFTNAVCSRDTVGNFCLGDIINGTVVPNNPVLPLATNLTAPANTTVPVAPANDTSMSFLATTMPDSTPSFNISTFANAALNPVNLFVQMTSNVAQGVTRRLVKRATTGNVTTGNMTSSSFPALASPNSSFNSSSNGSSITITGSNSSLPTNSSLLFPLTYSLLPNATTYRNTSLPFLFLSPLMASPILCTPCTKSILSAYITWESSMPYILGLSNSPLLGGQGDLYTGVGDVCGAGFLGSIEGVAGKGLTSASGGKYELSTLLLVIAMALGSGMW